MTDAEPTSAVPSLELCLVSRDGDYLLLDLAVKVKHALEKYREDMLRRQENDRIRQGVVRILVGEEIPVCPCCGTTS